jgi:hypothetical protein
VQLAGAIYNDGAQDACAPLLDWLRVAITQQGENQASRLQQEHPRVPLMLPALIQRRWQLIINDLPALSAGATFAAGQMIATSLNALVADNREFRNADEIRREQNSARTKIVALMPGSSGRESTRHVDSDGQRATPTGWNCHHPAGV